MLNYAISTTNDGNMSYRFGSEGDVNRNRAKFFAKHGLNSEYAVVMYVADAHQNIIVEVDQTNQGRGAGELESAIRCDALITKQQGLPLFLLVADCVPMIVYDSRQEILALVHLGWVDTDQLLARGVINELLNKYGSKVEDLEVVIGPCLRQDSYRYKDPRQKTDPGNFAGWQNFLKPFPDGTTGIGNAEYVKHQLQQAGIHDHQVQDNGMDTGTDPSYYSHYLDSQAGVDDKGRFGVVAWMG